MRRRSSTALFLAAAFLGFGLPSASAQPHGGSLAGAWRMETAPHDPSGCVIRGDATVSPGRNGRYAVRLDVIQTCPGETGRWARESCEATVAGDTTAIRCTVTASESGEYKPDSFTLRRVAPDVMTGRLVDTGVWNTAVTWRRAGAPLVS